MTPIAPEGVFIDVAKDFSRTPGGRYISESKWSGEEFRQNHLEPPLRLGKTITVDLDGVVGITSSFLEEAFGGLVRVFGVDIVKRISFVAPTRPTRARKALEYVQRAIALSNG